jgi:glycosyltransferase involved in cell wall biosynthesis
MDLSVVIPTLNDREELRGCLDSLTAYADDIELIVVNGPSSDGTTGMVRDRDDVDVLVEVSERNGNVARNAGIATATGDAVAFVSSELVVEPSWYGAVMTSLEAGADVVTGPTHRSLRAGVTTEKETTETVAGRTVTFFNGDNVAFDVDTLRALDGFDEFLAEDGERDASHRLAGMNYSITWNGKMCVRGEFEADGGWMERAIGSNYRSRAYRLVKNYGIRPLTASKTLWRAFRDSIDAAGDVTRGDLQPTVWLRSGQDVIGGLLSGGYAGLRARRADRTSRRNPNGVSTRHDRAVRRYDRR